MRKILTTLCATSALLCLGAPPASAADADADNATVHVSAHGIPGTRTVAFACVANYAGVAVSSSFSCGGVRGTPGTPSFAAGTTTAAADGTYRICWSFSVVDISAATRSTSGCITGSILSPK